MLSSRLKAEASNPSLLTLIDPKHPVISRLGAIFGGYLPGGKPVKPLRTKGGRIAVVDRHGKVSRCDVVDEELCDDVIRYLAPTLERHKGCTLIDVNPGACVWSSKLHEFLQPKRHLLMEPDERYIEPFIRPLLDKPGSRYLHTATPGLHNKKIFDTFNDLVKDEAFDFEPFLSRKDPDRRQLQTEILLTGNLARILAYEQGALLNHISDVTLHHITRTSLYNQHFHRNGPVRQLFWYPENRKRLAIPRRTIQKSSFNIGMHLGAEITEVVGTRMSTSAGVHRPSRDLKSGERQFPERHAALSRENTKIVEAKMREAGMTVPPGREILSPLNASAEKHDFQIVSPLIIRHQTLSELAAELERVLARKEEVHKVLLLPKMGNQRTFKKNKPEMDRRHLQLRDTLEYPQCPYIVHEVPYLNGFRPPKADATDVASTPMAKHRITLIMDLQFRIINLEAHCKHFEDQGVDTQEISSRVIALDKAFRAMCIAFRQVTIDILDDICIDQLAFYSSPPSLPFDRRSCEAFKASLESFWPRFELCLLDIVPNGRDLTVPDLADNVEVSKSAYDLLKYLFESKSATVIAALDRIAPNAAQDLMPMVKSFSDPRRGGRMNMEMLRVRMLTEDMVGELAKAWYEWPFRPSPFELALATGGVDAGAGEEEGVGEGMAVDTE